MVQIVSGTNVALRFDTLDLASLLTGNITTQTATTIVVDAGGGLVITFTGAGFTYNAGIPSGGTITSVHQTLNGSDGFNFSGLNLSVATFAQLALAHDSSGALGAFFSGNDNFSGTPQSDYIEGLDGHDNLFGGNGADTLGGGDGNDHLYGQSASGGADGADQLFGDDGSDYLQGNAGNDTLNGGTGSDRINGGADDDDITGGEGNDTVNGNLGADNVDGGEGNDSLRGGQGNDSIDAGDGNDLVSGDLGVDSLTGGGGLDIFVFSGPGSTLASPDEITDFEDGVDHIALGFIPTFVTAGSGQANLSAAAVRAQQIFDEHAGDHEAVSIVVGANQVYLFYASNGGATVDSAIYLSNLGASSSFAFDDFV